MPDKEGPIVREFAADRDEGENEGKRAFGTGGSGREKMAVGNKLEVYTAVY